MILSFIILLLLLLLYEDYIIMMMLFIILSLYEDCENQKLDDNHTRMLRAILNKSWRQHPTKQQLYGHLPPITKTIQVRQTRHVGLCWRSKDELISDILQWTPSHRRAKGERPARTYIQQLCADTGCSLEDRLRAMDDRDGWRERVRGDPCWGRDMMMIWRLYIILYYEYTILFFLILWLYYLLHYDNLSYPNYD